MVTHDVGATIPQPRPTRGRYQLAVTRDGQEVLRQGFDDLHDATGAAAEALVRYPDCAIRLVKGDTALLSAAPAPAGAHRRAPTWRV